MVNPEYLNARGLEERALSCLRDLIRYAPEKKQAAHTAIMMLVVEDANTVAAAAAAMAKYLKPEPPKPARKPRQRAANIVPLPPSIQ
jgi:hypothetical protein